MIPGHHWARNFSVTDDDIEHLTGLLLERETPLTTAELARALIARRLDLEAEALQEQYRDTRVYNPSMSYVVGQKVVFPALDFSVGTVAQVRPGENVDYGDFEVIAVEFDGGKGSKRTEREFAAGLKTPHKLSQTADEVSTLGTDHFSIDDILQANEDEIVGTLDEHLSDNADLVVLARHWFPRGLLLDVNEGHLVLAEAVLDIAQGGPLPTEDILEQVGGLGDAPRELQIFSLNYALNQDNRFDEVGPAGQVLWYLTRLEPQEVRETPVMLRYQEVEYDADTLSDDMRDLEAEIDDELSPINASGPQPDEITITLIYPHRRSGTLPLNAKMRRIFPTARRTQRIWVTLVDGQDGEEFQGWVVRKDRYVYGLMPFYQKHQLPVGSYLRVRPGDEVDKIVVDYRAHRPRTEWIRLITPNNNQISFDNQKRSIGAEYDDLMILGADSLSAVDQLFTQAQQSRRGLAGQLRNLIAELSRLTPQGTVHAKTLYSALNIVRRSPPGPIFATLVNDPDFEHVGNHYWKLSGTS